MRLSDIVRDPVIQSKFGEVREDISPKPHTGIDVVSASGDRFLRVQGRGQGVWQYNILSPLRDAAMRVRDVNGSEWPLGWYYSDRYGMMFVWLDEDSDIAFVMCHLDIFQTADIASHHGVHLWEHRTRHQTRYNVWHEFYGNVTEPAPLFGGELVGVYSDTGSSNGAHLHLEARRVEIGTDTRAEWEIIDPMDYLEA